jgi:hypothetical protein
VAVSELKLTLPAEYSIQVLEEAIRQLYYLIGDAEETVKVYAERLNKLYDARDEANGKQ